MSSLFEHDEDGLSRFEQGGDHHDHDSVCFRACRPVQGGIEGVSGLGEGGGGLLRVGFIVLGHQDGLPDCQAGDLGGAEHGVGPMQRLCVLSDPP